MNAISKTKSSSSGCGCGGAKDGSVATGCQCGGAGCTTCKGQGYMRPYFFAGQLLTEEDLQLLSDYVAAKNRLHNRHLFGEGVVCGLEVTCHPCGEGRVVVHPGYALDCCGNDLVLACEQTLDINGMIRDLRISKLGGLDCGDPCKDKETAKPSDAASRAAVAAGTVVTPKDQPPKPEEVTRHYCLYLRYCEELSDPVSPYATGDACASVACQPTRVREGIAFELRCREEDKPHNDMICRLLECLSDVISDRSRIVDSRAMLAYTNSFRMVEARQTVQAITFSASQVTDMANATAHLNEQLKAVTAQPKDEGIVWAAVETTRDLASIVARYLIYSALNQGETTIDVRATRAERRAKVTEQPTTELAEAPPSEKPPMIDRKAAENTVMDALRALEGARTVLPDRVAEVTALEIDREYAHALFTVVGDIQKQQINDGVRAIAMGDVYTQAFSLKFTAAMEMVREQLLDKLEQAEHLTDCSLAREIASISLPASASGEINTITAVSSLRNEAASLRDLYKRYLLNCICAALLPPCQPCDDTSVLLACLEVKDCDVIRICNLERTFVISPTAVRYWIPFRLLGEELEALCCGRPLCEDDKQSSAINKLPYTGFKPSESFSQNILALSRGASRFGAEELIANALAKLCGTEQDVKQYALVVNTLQRMFAQSGSAYLINQPYGRAEAMIQPAVAQAAAAQPAAPVDKEAVKAAVTDFLSRATFDETTELGRAVMGKVDALVAEKMAARTTKRTTTKSPESENK